MMILSRSSNLKGSDAVKISLFKPQPKQQGQQAQQQAYNQQQQQPSGFGSRLTIYRFNFYSHAQKGA